MPGREEPGQVSPQTGDLVSSGRFTSRGRATPADEDAARRVCCSLELRLDEKIAELASVSELPLPPSRSPEARPSPEDLIASGQSCQLTEAAQVQPAPMFGAAQPPVGIS